MAKNSRFRQVIRTKLGRTARSLEVHVANATAKQPEPPPPRQLPAATVRRPFTIADFIGERRRTLTAV